MTTATTWNPNGVTKGKPIALRLLPEEAVKASQIAKQRKQSKSAMAREAYLLGLPLLEDQSPSDKA